MVFDQAQSPRLGQPTPVENPGVRITTQANLPEVAYRGEMLYLEDLDVFQVYDGFAWQTPDVEQETGNQTFVQESMPMAGPSIVLKKGDLWMKVSTRELQVFDGFNWILTDEGLGETYNALAQSLLDVSAGEQTTFYVANGEPPEIGSGPASPTDIWLNRYTGQTFYLGPGNEWFGSGLSLDPEQILLLDAYLAHLSKGPGSRLTLFNQLGVPATTEFGALWMGTDLRRWNGTAWTSQPDLFGQVDEDTGEAPAVDYYVEVSFASSSTVWNYTHNQNTYALDVVTINGSGKQINGDVEWPTKNSVRVTFYRPQTGTMRIFE